MARIFLSYARADETQVRGVYRRLLDAGFEVWMDKINLLPGQRWEQEIPRAIRNSDFILIFFSKNSVARRGYIQREFRLALETLQEMPADAIHTIPIRLDDCQIPEQFRPLQWSDLSKAGEFDRIVQALRLGMEQRQTVAPAPALEPPPDPIPHSDRPFSASEGRSVAEASVLPPQEPEPTAVSQPEQPPVSDQNSRRVLVVTIIGLVIAAVGALAVVIVPEGREWLGLDKPLKSDQVPVGDQVLAMWKDTGCLYQGKVREAQGKSYRVFYTFALEGWVEEKNVFLPLPPTAPQLYPDTKVYVRVNGGQTRWVPAVIKDIQEGRYYVIFENGYKCAPQERHQWVAIESLVLREAMSVR